MINELAAVLGTIGTVFGIWSINRQMELEQKFAELDKHEHWDVEMIRINKADCERLIGELNYKIQDLANAHKLLEQSLTLPSGEYRKHYDEQTKEYSWKLAEQMDAKEALLNAAAPGFADKVNAMKKKYGYD